MKLAIVGYGKMGRMVEQLAPEYGFTSIATIDIDDDFAKAAGADAAIEFTTPDAALRNIEKLAGMKLPVVVGTTGWLPQIDRVRAVVEKNGSALVWSPNFSVGVCRFRQIIAQAASAFAAESEYQAWGWEIHHAAKRDAPSGTLLAVAEEMKQAGFDRAISLSANRAGAHPGTHEIGFDSSSDTITIRHTARSREGFARGALRAARWIVGKHGVFEFREIVNELG